MNSYFLFLNDKEHEGKLNIDDLYEKQQKKDQKQLSIFNKLLNRIHQKIKLTSRSIKNDRYIWYHVPEYIFGEPVYDQGECIAYLVNQLEENGFNIRYIHPNTLFISWAHYVPGYVRSEVRKKMGLVLDERGNIVERLEENKEEDLNERMFKKDEPAKKDGKEFTPIQNYKPTGQFMYDREFLEKIENKTDGGGGGGGGGNQDKNSKHVRF